MTDVSVEEIGCLKERGIAHDALKEVKQAVEQGIMPEGFVEEPAEAEEEAEEEEEEGNELVVHDED